MRSLSAEVVKVFDPHKWRLCDVVWCVESKGFSCVKLCMLTFWKKLLYVRLTLWSIKLSILVQVHSQIIAIVSIENFITKATDILQSICIVKLHASTFSRTGGTAQSHIWADSIISVITLRTLDWRFTVRCHVYVTLPRLLYGTGNWSNSGRVSTNFTVLSYCVTTLYI